MIKLTRLLQEAIGAPKAIIMAGSAGSGKTYISNKFKNLIPDWKYFNPDKYTRNKDSELYKNLRGASIATEKELNTAIETTKPNFVWDTVGANSSNILKIPASGYNTLMIMVYTHPMIAFYQNFKRAKEEGEESIFGRAVLDTWSKIYNPDLIKTYQEAFGDNFILVNNTPEADQDLINGFNKVSQESPEAIKQFIDSETKKNPEFYTVTQKKEKELLPKEVEDDFNEKVKSLGTLTPYEERKLKEKALEYYNKNNTFMPMVKQGRSNGFKENLESIKKAYIKSKEEENQIYQNLFNSFKNVVQSDVTIDQVVEKVKQFANS